MESILKGTLQEIYIQYRQSTLLRENVKWVLYNLDDSRFGGQRHLLSRREIKEIVINNSDIFNTRWR